jgi:predicted lysophospholipase L1 biosynthesis ABC-type transport system permease subunit
MVVDDAGGRFEVVGVVRRSKYLSVGEEPKPYVYFPLWQGSPSAMTIVARGRGDAGAHLRAIGAAVRRADATVPRYEVGRLSERIDTALAPTTGAAAALGGVGLVALALTSLGLFGAVAQAVSRRTYEIGVRRALGAPDRHVAWLMMRETVAAAALGVVCGVAIALPAAHLLGAMLYDVRATDPAVLGIASVTLVAVCLAAAALPALRAMRMNAATALRHE